MAGYLIGETLRLRLRETIDRVRDIPEGERPTRVDARFEELQRPGATNVRACSWTGTWSIGKTHQIELIGATQTATAVNSYFGWREPVPATAGSGVVIKQSGSWHLHSIDLETVQGITAVTTTSQGSAGFGILGCEAIYDPDPPPGEASGAPEIYRYLKWFQITACST